MTTVQISLNSIDKVKSFVNDISVISGAIKSRSCRICSFLSGIRRLELEQTRLLQFRTSLLQFPTNR